jgi:drug/metabolite transporter (DMT)-like permease
MSDVHLGEMAAIGTAVLWTLSALAWTSSGKRVGAVSVAFIRLVMTCVLLAGYGQLVHGQAVPLHVGRRAWIILGGSGVLGFFLSDLCFFKSLLLIGPRLSLLVQSLTPPLAAVISAIFFGDTLAGRQWFAMGVTLSGVSWVLLEQRDNGHPHQGPQLRIGVALAVMSAAAQAVGTVFAWRGMAQFDAGPVAATFLRVFPATVGYIILITLLGRWPAVKAAASHRGAMCILVGGTLVGPFAGVILSMVALKHCSPGVVTTIIATTPLLILPFSVLLYREKVSPRAAGGALISVTGVALLLLS